MVVLWSAASQQSPWVRDEGAYARDRNKLIPICLGDAEPPLGFRQMQSLRLGAAQEHDAVMADLVHVVRALVSGATPSQMPSMKGPPQRSSRTRWVAAAIVAALVLTGLLARTFIDSHDTPLGKADVTSSAGVVGQAAQSAKSIAVLPFADMSESHDQEYLADGMAEEIINLLAQAPGLLVPARTSSFFFKGKDASIADIARQLGVAHVLEGSIRRVGDRLRVTAQLVRADTGFHLWSETYDRELRDVFAVQDEIASAVAQALQIRLTGGELNRRHGGTQNLEAYQLLLKSYNVSAQNSAAEMDEAQRLAEAAIDRDPQYGLAWSQLAYLLSTKADNVLIDAQTGYTRARELALRALEFSPDMAETHGLLQHLYVMLEWDWAAAERERKLALAIDPTDSGTLLFAGLNANARGRWDEAEQSLRTALERDPLSTWTLFHLGNTYRGAARFDEAAATFRRILEIEPTHPWARSYLAKALFEKGDVDGALAISDAETDPALLAYSRPHTLLRPGRTAEADAALADAIARFGDVNAYAIAQIYAHRGDREQALDWLEKAYEQKNSGLLEIAGEAMFKTLCGDPRFDAFMRKMNLPPVTGYPFRGA